MLQESDPGPFDARGGSRPDRANSPPSWSPPGAPVDDPHAQHHPMLNLATLAFPLLLVPVQEGAESVDPVLAEHRANAAVVLDIAQTDNRVQQHLRYLTTVIGPRLTGSHNLAEAQHWAVRTLRSYGLNARRERWGEVAVGFNRGPWSGSMIVGDGPVDLVFNTMAWSAGTDGPERGRAVLWPGSQEELDAVIPMLDGAWLVERRWGRGERPGGDLRDAIQEAIQNANLLGRVTGVNGDRLNTSGRVPKDWESIPTEPRINLRGDFYSDLLERLKNGEELELEFDVQNTFVRGPVPQYNVIADLVGSEFPDEYVVVGGHLDSWDGAQGTVDNGTGASSTIEAARLLAASGIRPKRTIRFMLYSGEEQGLLGSRAYVKDHPNLMEKISAVLVHDGGTNYVAGIGGTFEMQGQLGIAFDPVLDLDPEMPFTVDEIDGLRNSGSSDHAPFIGAGVPGFFWNQDGRSEYGHMWHTQYDTFETAIPEYQKHTSTVVAVGALGIANLPEMLDRTNMEPVPARRMGVSLDDNRLSRVTDGGLAAEAGLQPDDRILSIDGEETTGRHQVTRAVQLGGPKKVFVIQRGEETLEVTLDWTGTDGEEERAKRRAAREAKAADK